jgi:hypothetical protein
MSIKKHFLVTVITLLISFTSVASALTTTDIYVVKNKASGTCFWAKYTKTYVSFGDCNLASTDNKLHFQLEADTTNYHIAMKSNGNLLDTDASDPLNLVNWPKDAVVPDSQKWQLTASGQFYTIKNIGKNKCVKYDANHQIGDSGIVPILADCPTTVTDEFLFTFDLPTVTVKGYVRYNTSGNTVPTTVWNTVGFTNKVTFKNADGTTLGDATIDGNASTYTMSVNPYKTYTIVATVYGCEQIGTPFQLAVDGSGIDGVTDTSITKTTVKVSPYKFTWKIQLWWNNKERDLDLYVQSSKGCNYYGRKTSQFVNYITDLTNYSNVNLEEVQVLPTLEDSFYVYVKNHSRDVLLKETDAKITITKSRLDGANTVTLTPIELTVPVNNNNAKHIYWKAFTIDATTQSHTAHSLVCADPNNC